MALFWWTRLRIMHTLDVLLSWVRGMPKKRDANLYLKGLYAPIDVEQCHTQLKVEGSMPKSMNGAYVRVGPNPLLRPIGDYHWFDGDGMTHTVRIKDGKCSYANNYVETSRLKQERAAGFPLFEKIGDCQGPGYLVQMGLQQVKKVLGVLDDSQGKGRGNTALVFHAKQLLTLEEGDMPYALRVLCNGVVDTIGRTDFNGKLKHVFTAHPKKDPVTGELFGFGYSVDKAPHCTYTALDADGNIVRDFPVHIPRGIMMHDCACTEDNFIFLDLPLRFAPDRIVKNGELPFFFDKSINSRFGVMPRMAEDESAIKWFELPPMTIFHTANAWQEGPDIVKLAACCFDEFELDIGSAHFKTPGHMPRLHLLTFNLKTGEASKQRLAHVVGDFPQINGEYLGRKTRYAYLATMPEDGLAPNFSGVTKVDLQAPASSPVAGQITYLSDWEGGEAFFVPADAENGRQPDEDEGYLVNFIMHKETGESKLAVFDAKTMSSQPVATVAIPQRVPAGFHGLHVKERDLALQS